jgi:hypothetical protein
MTPFRLFTRDNALHVLLSMSKCLQSAHTRMMKGALEAFDARVWVRVRVRVRVIRVRVEDMVVRDFMLICSVVSIYVVIYV